MSIKETGEHKFAYVKKASMYCETWFEVDRNGKAIQKQAWHSKEEYEALLKKGIDEKPDSKENS